MWRVRVGLVLSTVVAAGVCGCAAPGPAGPSSGAVEVGDRSGATSRPGGGHLTLIVHGMGCPLCANNVDKQLLAVRGVQGVRVNLGTGQVVVRVSPAGPPPSREELTEAVARSGYTLVRIDAGGVPPAGVPGLFGHDRG